MGVGDFFRGGEFFDSVCWLGCDGFAFPWYEEKQRGEKRNEGVHKVGIAKTTGKCPRKIDLLPAH